MNFLKKQRVGFYINILTFIMLLVSTIIFGINARNSLFISVLNVNPGIYAELIISILLIAVIFVLDNTNMLKNENIRSILISILRVVICILIGVGFINFTGARVENIGYLFGSDLYLGNEPAIAAVTQSITVIVLLAITWLISLIGTFFSLSKK